MYGRSIEIDSSYNCIYSRIRGLFTYSCKTPSKMIVSPTFIVFLIDHEFGWKKKSWGYTSKFSWFERQFYEIRRFKTVAPWMIMTLTARVTQNIIFRIQIPITSTYYQDHFQRKQKSWRLPSYCIGIFDCCVLAKPRAKSELNRCHICHNSRPDVCRSAR